MDIRLFDIVMVDLGITVGSEQGGKRPVVILQNNTGNMKSTTTIVAPLSRHIDKKPFQPTHTLLRKSVDNGLKDDSVVLCEQVRVISSQRILWKIGNITNENDRLAIGNACKANFGF